MTKKLDKGWSSLSAIIKRFLDIIISIFALLFLSPVICILIILLLINGGSVFYLQERIGKNFKPFQIIKFRSMVKGAEVDKPMLANADDERITKIGKVLRKWRLDEIPQFFNVIAGNMSIVGPRPERNYFIKNIVREFPEYKKLLSVKPGITGSGMVEYGYAENTKEMIERAAYDLAYINNLSLINDMSILLKTVKVIWDGRGQ